MTRNEKLKAIVKLMMNNSITLHDLADELNKQILVWGANDVKYRITERNQNYGEDLTEEEINNIAQEVIDRLDFLDYGQLYHTMDCIFDELIEDVISERNEEKNNE